MCVFSVFIHLLVHLVFQFSFTKLVQSGARTAVAQDRAGLFLNHTLDKYPIQMS